MKYSRKRLVSEEREKEGSELLRGHSDQIGATTKVGEKKYMLACVWPGNVQFLCLIEADTFGFWNLYKVCASAYFNSCLPLTSGF